MSDRIALLQRRDALERERRQRSAFVAEWAATIAGLDAEIGAIDEALARLDAEARERRAALKVVREFGGNVREVRTA